MVFWLLDKKKILILTFEKELKKGGVCSAVGIPSYHGHGNYNDGWFGLY
jgi:hypothetical protein